MLVDFSERINSCQILDLGTSSAVRDKKYRSHDFIHRLVYGNEKF